MRRNEQEKTPSLAGTSEGETFTKTAGHGLNGTSNGTAGYSLEQPGAPDEGDRPGTGREQTKLEQDFLRARRQTPGPRFPPTRAGRCRPR